MNLNKARPSIFPLPEVIESGSDCEGREAGVPDPEPSRVEDDALALEEHRRHCPQHQALQGVLGRVDQELVELVVCEEHLLSSEGEDLFGESEAELLRVCHNTDLL